MSRQLDGAAATAPQLLRSAGGGDAEFIYSSGSAAATCSCTTAYAIPRCGASLFSSHPPPLELLLAPRPCQIVAIRPTTAAALSVRPVSVVAGSGEEPPAIPVHVTVSVYLDRLMAVDDNAYQFEVRACVGCTQGVWCGVV